MTMTTQLTESTKMLDKHARTERVVAQTISLFRAGYRLSFAFVAIGLVVALVRDIPLAAELGPPKELLDHLLNLDPNGFIGLGIGIMILTPILMTVEVTVNFFRVGDRRFAGITALVALILIVTLGLAFV
jgi:uncharacterized membrane protein